MLCDAHVFARTGKVMSARMCPQPQGGGSGCSKDRWSQLNNFQFLKRNQHRFENYGPLTWELFPSICRNLKRTPEATNCICINK